MSKVEVIVKIKDSAVDKVSEIVRECERVGMSIEQQMKAMGMISGAVERENISKLERIDGVSYVETAKTLGNA